MIVRTVLRGWYCGTALRADCELEVDEGVESVLLPFRTSGDLSDAEVEWWRYEPEPPMTVHRHQHGLNRAEDQHQFYRERTEMRSEFKDPSLTLKYPTDRDSGNYICTVEVDSEAESVLLPFRTTPELPEDATVVWWKLEPEHVKVHVYQKGCERAEEQEESYRNRTQICEDLLRTGDLSLTLRCPTDGDSGTYRCEVYSETKKSCREKTVIVKVQKRSQGQTVAIRKRRKSTSPSPLLDHQPL
ncbi:hypothetical protein CRENBAI_026433 [Crenichthys baileyi]|uniref:Ig-like domain-containing protein n=1 Tax=Crenichthys baileyi TaxID=28760 RepID=A0AAV9RVW9_9TELE